MLGSSLMTVPSFRCDELFDHKRPRYDKWLYNIILNSYPEAKFFTEILAEHSSRRFKIKNMALSASMFSDQLWIVKHLIEHGKRPSLLICGITYRDCCDNSCTLEKKIPVLQALEYDLDHIDTMIFSLCLDTTDNGFSSDSLARMLRIFQSCRHKILNEYNLICLACKALAQQDLAYLLSCIKSQLAQALRLAHSQKTCTPILLKKQSDELVDQPDYCPIPNTLQGLEIFRARYQPANLASIKPQFESLESLIKIAKQHKIEVILVHLPLTHENKMLIPPEVCLRYLHSYVNLCQRQNIPFLNLEQEKQYQFSIEDYEDSIHLNARGGKKLFTAISYFLLRQAQITDILQVPEKVASKAQSLQ